MLKIPNGPDRKGQRGHSCSWEGLAEAAVEAYPPWFWESTCWKEVGTELTAPEERPGAEDAQGQ